MITVIGLSIILAIVLLVLHLQFHCYFLQYLFFCRFPVLIAIVLAVVLPGAMLWFAEDLVGNLAVLNFWEILSTSFLATILAWTIMFTIARFLEWIPVSAKLHFYRRQSPVNVGRPRGWLRRESVVTRVVGWMYETMRRDPKPVVYQRLGLYLLIAIPLIIVAVWRSTPLQPDESHGLAFFGRQVVPLLSNALAAVLGVGVACGIRWLTALGPRVLRDRTPASARSRFGALKDSWPVDQFARPIHMKAVEAVRGVDSHREGAEGASKAADEDKILRRTWQGLGFFAMAFVIYWIGFFVLHPEMRSTGPSLLMILMLLMVLCFVMTGVAAVLGRGKWLPRKRMRYCLEIRENVVDTAAESGVLLLDPTRYPPKAD